MDPMNIMQVSILSRMMNDPTNLFDNPYIFVCFVIFLCIKIMPYPIYISIENKLNKWIFEQNESSITIPYHIKTYGSYGSGKSVQKILYSNRFRAMNYHIKKYHLSKLYSLNEIINLENTKFLECVSDFILVPKDNQKIMID